MDTEAEEFLSTIADDAGWSKARQVKLLCRFIEETGLTGEMEVFLNEAFEEESDDGDEEDD